MSGKVEIIAEAGVNHNGSLEMAKTLIEVAAKSGADFVKFQTFKAQNLATKNVSKANYQKKSDPFGSSQFEMLKELELTRSEFALLAKYCVSQNIKFLSSPFDHESLSFLVDDLKLDNIKFGSGELTNAPLLLSASKTSSNLIISTGMSSISEVEEALGVIAFGITTDKLPTSREDFAKALLDPEIWNVLKQKVILLHCTTEYPAIASEVNLRVIQTLQSAFGLRVGYSDHTHGAAVSCAAATMGASVIEKHFTLDKTLKGPDHSASLEPLELNNFVRDIRTVEVAIGTGIKQPRGAELENRNVARKCLVAGRKISAGSILTIDDLAAKRGNGKIPPVALWEIIGKKANVAIEADDPIFPGMLDG